MKIVSGTIIKNDKKYFLVLKKMKNHTWIISQDCLKMKIDNYELIQDYIFIGTIELKNFFYVKQKKFRRFIFRKKTKSIQVFKYYKNIDSYINIFFSLLREKGVYCG